MYHALRSTAIVILAFISLTCFSQGDNGLYISSKNDTLEIYKDSLVRFNFEHGCCLLLRKYGYGKLRKKNDYFIVDTEKSDLFNSKYTIESTENKNSDLIEIIILDEYDYASKSTSSIAIDSINVNNPRSLIGAIIEICDANGNLLKSYIQKDDYLTIELPHNSQKFITYSMGYSEIEFHVDKFKGKKVALTPRKGYEVYNLDLQLNLIDIDTIILQNIISKNYESEKLKRLKRDVLWYLTTFPWNWKYKDFHTPGPKTFIRQRSLE